MSRFALALIFVTLLISGPAAAQVNGVAFDATKGVILLGSPAGAANCAAATLGAIRYNSTSLQVEFCNGTSWAAFHASGLGGVPPCGTSGTLSSQQMTTIRVPVGCHVTFKVWGGGGAGGSTSSDTGGGGGYATITLGPLGSITTYFLVVGGGGTANGPGGASISGYTGGSPAGGGASGVWTSNYGGTPVVVAGGGGGIGHSGNGWQSGFAAGVTTYSGIALQETGGVTTGADCDYGGGGAGYPDGGAACPVSGYWSGGGGDNYAAGGGSTTAGSGVNPGNSGDANRPANAGQGSPGSWWNGYDGAIYYTTF